MDAFDDPPCEPALVSAQSAQVQMRKPPQAIFKVQYSVPYGTRLLTVGYYSRGGSSQTLALLHSRRDLPHPAAA